MMRNTFVLILILFLFSFCHEVSEKTENSVTKKEKTPDTLSAEKPEMEIDTVALGILFTPGKNYESSKTTVTSERTALRTRKMPDSIVKIHLEKIILSELIPYWYGTPWDFNGYTDIPKKGVIACGYFVSTVMKHAGFNVNRYKLAQQDPMNEAKTIAGSDTVAVYETNAADLQEIFNSTYEEGLYFVGLDFHVGFLLFRNKELYFIHSNYIGAQGVIFEKALFSEAFNAAQKYRVAKLSSNPDILKKWLNGAEIKVVTGK